MVFSDVLAVCLVMIEDEHDKKKFEDLFEKYAELMRYKASTILKDTYYAEDAVSIALFNVAAHINMVEEVDSIRTRHLVMTMIQRVSFNLYKKIKQEQNIIINLEDIKNVEISVVDIAEEFDDFVSNEILKLPSPYKEVILLKYADGYNNREIAALLDLTVSNVNKIVTRGKRKLEQALEREWENEINR